MTIFLQKDNAALLTQRFERQSLSAFFSNLSGSILGILGTIGFVMNILEGKLEEIKLKATKKYNIIQLGHRRNNLYYLNFNEQQRNQTDKIKKIRKSRDLFDNLAMESHFETYYDIKKIEPKLQSTFGTDNSGLVIKMNKVAPL